MSIEVCEHGRIKRKCDTCLLIDDLKDANARIAELERNAKICPNCASSIGECGHCDECIQQDNEQQARIAELEAALATEREVSAADHNSGLNLAHYCDDPSQFDLAMSGNDIIARDTIRELRQQLAEAKAVVEQKPKTKDGVPVFDGMEVFGYSLGAVRHWKVKATPARYECHSAYPIEALYSTREAALASGEGK